MTSSSLYCLSLEALRETYPERKVEQVRLLSSQWRENKLALDDDSEVFQIEQPGRPLKPVLVHPRELKKRRLSTEEGRGIFVHAIAHIEFNAINLALDAVYRFREMPEDFYSDWLRVAEEEASHFQLLSERLSELGYHYGDFPAHDGLWDMAVQTDGDLLSRMALIPCVFEARGLDVTPAMIERLKKLEDARTVEILELILHEEIEHVAIGQRWFRYECSKRQLDPEQALIDLVSEYLPGRKHGPFNTADRIKAGFSEFQLYRLSQL